MIAKMAFPLKDLAENRGDGTCENIQDQESQLGSQHRRSMEFKFLGLAHRETSDPDCLYTEDDLSRAVDEARRIAVLETEASVRAVMANDIEKRQCDLLAAIKDQLGRHESVFEEELARLAGLSHELAIALAKAVIPRAIERQPLVDITDLLKLTITGLAEAPAIELRLHPSHVESGKALMVDLAREVGFAGEVTTASDPGLAEGDAELRWKSGAVSRQVRRLEAEAIDLADRWLKNLPKNDGNEAHTSPSVASELNTSDGLPDQINDKESTHE